MSDPFEMAGAGIEILAPLRERVVPLWQRWWLGCDEGWYPMLTKLGEDLSEIAPDWSLLQAKEKFAALRFYAEPGTDDPETRRRFEERIETAERESAQTCERCGRAGEIRRTSSGALKTLCSVCLEAIVAEGGPRFLSLDSTEATDG